MILVRNVPVVIEPGVGVLEAELAVVDGLKKPRHFPVQLFRIDLTQDNLPDLPFIPSIRLAHAFALTPEPKESVIIVVYDHLGRITLVFNRDETGKAWDKKEVAAEHAGKTVTQFSVRFSFHSSKTRNKFMEGIDEVLAQLQRGEHPDPERMHAVFALLAKTRVAPVLMPVAVPKTAVKDAKVL